MTQQDIFDESPRISAGTIGTRFERIEGNPNVLMLIPFLSDEPLEKQEKMTFVLSVPQSVELARNLLSAALHTIEAAPNKRGIAH